MRVSKFSHLRPGEKFIIGPGSSLLPEHARLDPDHDYVLMEKVSDAAVLVHYNGTLMCPVNYLLDVPVIKIRM